MAKHPWVTGELSPNYSCYLLSDRFFTSAEETARKHSVSREAQDDYAIESYRRAAEATKSGAYKNEIAPVTIKDPRRGDTVITEDEEVKNIKLDKVRGLRPVFQKENGTVTAANASSINDGASAVIVATQEKIDEYGLKPIARILCKWDYETRPVVANLSHPQHSQTLRAHR